MDGIKIRVVIPMNVLTPKRARVTPRLIARDVIVRTDWRIAPTCRMTRSSSFGQATLVKAQIAGSGGSLHRPKGHAALPVGQSPCPIGQGPFRTMLTSAGS